MSSLINYLGYIISGIEAASPIITIILIILVAIWFSYQLGKWSNKLEGMYKSTEELKTEVKVLPELKAKLELIYDYFIEKRRTVESSSPLTVTKFGKELVQKLSINEIVDRTYPLIKEETNIDADMSVYDIQKVLSDFFSYADRVEKYLDSEETSRFKEEAYQQGIMLEDIYGIMAVMCRDKILAEINKSKSVK